MQRFATTNELCVIQLVLHLSRVLGFWRGLGRRCKRTDDVQLFHHEMFSGGGGIEIAFGSTSDTSQGIAFGCTWDALRL